MKALILAAGKGERLRPLTDELPKVMVDVAGKPCLQHNIELLKKHGITKLFINTHYHPEKIRDYFGNGENFGVQIEYSYEPQILGTSGALHNFKFNQDFFVLYGDVIHQTDLQEMLQFHNHHVGLATLALDDRDQRSRGVVITKGDRVVSFIEKPEQHIPEGRINSGVYLLDPRIRSLLPPGFSDFGKDIFPKALAQREMLYGFKTGKVIDIGTLTDLEYARKLLAQPAES